MKYMEVMMVIKDVLKFVQISAGVIDRSTPHLYLSGLAFSPSQSVITKHLERFSGIAKVAVGQQNDWPRNEHVPQCGPVSSVALSPNGRCIVSGSMYGTIQVWDAQTGGQVGNPLQGRTKSVLSVAFSPDGRHIVSGSWDNTIRVWDAQTGGQVGRWATLSKGTFPQSAQLHSHQMEGTLCQAPGITPFKFGMHR